MIYKALHRKLQLNNDLQSITQKTTIKQWSTKHYTENYN